MAAIDDLNELLESLPGYELISQNLKTSALANALIPDSFGVWPGREGYETTHDVYFAALGLLGFLQAQPVIRQTSSEGTSLAVDAPYWSSLINYYRGQSPIVQVQGGSVLSVIDIPQSPHVVRTDMSGGDSYGDVDTDIS